jgi:CHAD domain-containing protein
MSACGKHPTVENFHEWRKRVKYYRYQLKLLRDFWKPVMEALRREAVKLSDDLGDDHDLAVLVEYLGENERLFDRGCGQILKGTR